MYYTKSNEVFKRNRRTLMKYLKNFTMIKLIGINDWHTQIFTYDMILYLFIIIIILKLYQYHNYNNINNIYDNYIIYTITNAKIFDQ